MVTAADWIKVELSARELAACAELAQGRDQRARAARAVRKGYGSVATHTLGLQGEMAVARYEGVGFDESRWRDDVRRGYDIAGWQVRTGSHARYGLNLHKGDHGRFLLALGHERPVIWLTGWAVAEQVIKLAERHEDGEGDRVWWRVDKKHLEPLPEQNGYGRATESQLIPMDTEFYCDACGSHHPIGEHKECRTGTSRQMLLLERSQRIRASLDFTPDQ